MKYRFRNPISAFQWLGSPYTHKEGELEALWSFCPKAYFGGVGVNKTLYVPTDISERVQVERTDWIVRHDEAQPWFAVYTDENFKKTFEPIEQ